MKIKSTACGGSLVLLALLGACSSSPQETTEATVAEPLYGLGSFGAAWPNGVVPVCFQDTSASPDLQALVKSTLNSGWARAANITFTGFGACAPSGNQTTVVFQAGMNGAAVTNGTGLGARVTTLPNDTTNARLAAVTLHEFGHVLGFAHEMGRPDNWVGGVAGQCGGFDPSEPGGVYLTASYDPDSIMNYCADDNLGAPALSVGDILGVSSPSGYGPQPFCTFPSLATTCSATTGSTFEETFAVPPGCPTPWDAWVLQVNQGGVWTNVQHACPNGQPAGTCGTATNPNAFTLGSQGGYGDTGAPAGSVQSARMCGANGNCTAPFSLTVPACNLFYISPGNNPLQVTQGGDSVANLLMYGPWISADKGQNGSAYVVSNPSSAVTFSFGLGSPSVDPGTAWIPLTAQATSSAPVGTYDVYIAGKDPTSGVTVVTEFPVEVLACTTTPVSQVCKTGACGAWSIGCGQETDCGGCPAGDSCSYGTCCPAGSSSNGEGGCVSNTPPTCPPTKPYCAALDACATALQCSRAGGGGGGGCKGTQCM